MGPLQLSPAVQEVHGRAMGSRVQIIGVGDPHRLGPIIDSAFERIFQLEARWSRFRPTSEVSRLNAQPGVDHAVSLDTLELVDRAVEASLRTGGLFNPTMLRNLEASGYDRSFALIDFSEIACDGLTVAPGVGGIDIDRRSRTVRLPDDVGFDPGGLGKGLAADLVASYMMETGAAGVLVNVGGDLRCRGIGPDGGGWVITVGDTVAGVDTTIVELADGGVATSTCRRRRWATSRGPAHHLIDPGTGRPAEHAADSVTVISANSCDAETLATALAVKADRSDPMMLGDAAAIVHHADGRTSHLGPTQDYIR